MRKILVRAEIRAGHFFYDINPKPLIEQPGIMPAVMRALFLTAQEVDQEVLSRKDLRDKEQIKDLTLCIQAGMSMAALFQTISIFNPYQPLPIECAKHLKDALAFMALFHVRHCEQENKPKEFRDFVERFEDIIIQELAVIGRNPGSRRPSSQPK